MNLQIAARLYLRFFNGHILADNAPPELRNMLGSINSDRFIVQRALRQLAGEELPPESRSLPDLLNFFSISPAAQGELDRPLRSKVPPKTVEELFQRAYNDHCIAVLSQVRKWLIEQAS